jgi:uncharacterized protein
MTTPPPPPPSPDEGRPAEQHDPDPHDAGPQESQQSQGHPYPGQQSQGQQPYPGQQSQGQQPYPGQQSEGQQYGQPPTAYSSARQLSPSEERTWAIFAHLSAPIAFLLSAGSLNFLGPLIIWAIFKDRSALVRRASAGAFNFNVSIWIINALVGLLAVVTLGLGLLIAVPVWVTTFVVAAVLHIMAAIKASNGEGFTYPLQLPILK